MAFNLAQRTWIVVPVVPVGAESGFRGVRCPVAAQ